MKSSPSPVAYPTDAENAERWGFDIFEPVGTPRAWIQDWSSALSGFGMPMESIVDLTGVAAKAGTDLSKLSVDDMFAAFCFMYRMDFHDLFKIMERTLGKEKTREILHELGLGRGAMGWLSSQGQYGAPLPLDKIALYQDFAHMLFGPNMQAYSWYDDEKVVNSRKSCSFSPPRGIEDRVIYCRDWCGGMTEGYMQVEPTLLCARVMDIGEDGSSERCVLVWTYDPKVMEKVPAELVDNIPENMMNILKDRGVEF
jgi:hypothetical protein